MTKWREIASILILATACGDESMPLGTSATAPTSAPTTNPATTNNPPTSDTDDTSATATDATSTSPTTGTTSVEGGPMFLSFTTTVATLTQNESVQFSAILTDPDGLADIAGGSLKSVDETVDFGTFTAEGQPGTYSLTLSWAQIHQSAPIQFEGGEDKRTFRAVFFDQQGHKAADDVELALVCAGGAACDGTCTDLAVDGLNCGTCGYLCDAGKDGCAASKCKPAMSECVNWDDGVDTCAAACQLFGETCAENACNAGITARFYNNPMDCEADFNADNVVMACDQVHPWVPGAMSIRCCCTDTK